MVPRLASPTPGAETTESPSTASMGQVSTTQREMLPTGQPLISPRTDQRWLFGAALAILVTAAVVLFLAFGSDSGPSKGDQGNCAPGQTVQENGYCG